jgi:predicted HTH domain antitoxin
MTKTMSIRIDKESYDFITALSREEKGDLSKAVRELVYRGRVLLAVEKYKKREASLGKAAEIAGLPIGRMVTLLADYGVESNLEKEDYLEGLQNLRKVW